MVSSALALSRKQLPLSLAVRDVFSAQDAGVTGDKSDNGCKNF
jgi:hypothetical protein